MNTALKGTPSDDASWPEMNTALKGTPSDDASWPEMNTALKGTPSDDASWPEMNTALKGTPSDDASRPEKVQTFPAAGFVCLFYQYLCNRSTVLLCFKFELCRAQLCLVPFSPMTSRKGWDHGVIYMYYM